MAPAGAKVLEAAPVGAGEAADEGLEAALPAPPFAALVGDPALELAADSTESVAVLTASVEAAGTVLRGRVMPGQPGDRRIKKDTGFRHSRSTVLDGEEVGSDKRAETALSHVAGKVPGTSGGAGRAEVGWGGEGARLLIEEPCVSVGASAGERAGACKETRAKG